MLNSITYLYQRNGVFYIRLRMKTTGRLTASLPSHNRYKLASVSLRTKDRRTAMAHSRHIKSALKAIHADNPSASYEELREHLKTIVEWELSVSRDESPRIIATLFTRFLMTSPCMFKRAGVFLCSDLSLHLESGITSPMTSNLINQGHI